MRIESCPLCGAERWRHVYTTRADGMETAERFFPGRDRFESYLCEGCGFVRQHPLPSEAQLARFYGGYRCFRDKDDGFLTRAFEGVVRFLDEATETLGWHTRPGSARVLDVGCGGGELLELLAAKGAEVLGMELSPPAAEQVEQGAVPVIYGGIDAEPPGAPFDLVCSVTVLEHLRDPLGAVLRMRDWVRDDGLLLLEVPDLERPRVGTADFLSYQHLTHWTPETFRGLLNRAGLEVLAEDPRAPHSVRFLARRAEAGAWTPAPDLPSRVAAAIDTYRERRERLVDGVVERLERALADGRRFAVFGAGDHSLQLLQVLDLTPAVVAFLDSDPDKQGTRFEGRLVLAPAALDSLDVDAVLLSSQPFQEEMARTVASVDGRNLDVIRLYPS